MKERILATEPNKTYLLIRIMVGFFFLIGGILKFSFPELQTTGYYESFGTSAAQTIASTITFFEILCGLMIVAGIYTRIASIPLLITISLTVLAGKLPIMFEEGFFLMAHISRVDFAMFLGCVFLLINGSGLYSVDWKLQSKESL